MPLQAVAEGSRLGPATSTNLELPHHPKARNIIKIRIEQRAIHSRVRPQSGLECNSGRLSRLLLILAPQWRRVRRVGEEAGARLRHLHEVKWRHQSLKPVIGIQGTPGAEVRTG